MLVYKLDYYYKCNLTVNDNIGVTRITSTNNSSILFTWGL